MTFSRDVALKIHFFLDECLPPILRDRRWFMRPLLRLFYGSYTPLFLDFKPLSPFMSADDMAAFYAQISLAPPRRKTDLNKKSIDLILQQLAGVSVLEVGAGDLHLTNLISKTHPVTAADVFFSREARTIVPSATLVEAPIEELPFHDQQFDTVVCTHTLEHVLALPKAVAELRRVCKQRLIIVVPKQRPYLYTFDPHLQFFPYEFSLRLALGAPIGPSSCKLVGGDWYYTEERMQIGTEKRSTSGFQKIGDIKTSLQQ